MSLRERAENDLSVMLEDPNQWGIPVELTAPDGKEYNTSANSPDPQNPLSLYGQVFKNTVRVNPETGEPLVVGVPAVVLRLTSLARVPEPGERWLIKFPTEPSLTAEMQDFVLSPDRSPEKNSSLGFIVLYPTKVEQSP